MAKQQAPIRAGKRHEITKFQVGATYMRAGEPWHHDLLAGSLFVAPYHTYRTLICRKIRGSLNAALNAVSLRLAAPSLALTLWSPSYVNSVTQRTRGRLNIPAKGTLQDSTHSLLALLLRVRQDTRYRLPSSFVRYNLDEFTVTSAPPLRRNGVCSDGNSGCLCG